MGTGQPDFVPPGPDLSAREFVDLDLDRLSTLEVDPTSPAVAPSVTPGTLPRPADGSADGSTVPGATGQPTAPPSAVAADATATPAPAAANASPAATSPVTAAPTPAGSNYYVVMGFTGDASLTTAREVVTDAFVRNFSNGTYIQVAAFDNEAGAKAQIEALQQRGLTVQLYGPTDE